MRYTMIAFAAAALVLPAAGVAGTYSVDAGQSRLLVRLYKAGLGSAMAHNHVIRATAFEGTVRWDPATPADASVEVEVDARELVADESDLRAELGMEGELSESKRADVQQTMESKKQLDVERYPTIAFRSTSVESAGDGAIRVSGELELHGTTRDVTFTTVPEVEGDTLRSRAEIEFLQSDYGIEPYSAFLGMVKNQDGAKLVVDLVAVAEASDEEPGPEEPPAAEGATGTDG